MTTTWKLLSCLALVFFLTGCGGGGGGGGSSASLTGASQSFASPLSVPGTSDYSYSGPGAEEPQMMLTSFSMFVPDVGTDLSDIQVGGTPEDGVPNPEPATMTLFGIGLGGMALLKRKRV